jgi:hypothetical protein
LSNYTKSTNFATKDNLSSGNPLKIVKGTEIDTEFNDIATAIATKADLLSPTFTGTPLAPTATAGTNTTQLATTAFVQAAMTALFPVGAIYTAVVSTNPATLIGFGTWTAFGAGRVMVGFDSGNALFDTAEETGGSANATLPSHTHTATVTDPSHSHAIGRAHQVTAVASGPTIADPQDQSSAVQNTQTATTGITVSNSTEGSSATNANYQPYITVYMWKRTA